MILHGRPNCRKAHTVCYFLLVSGRLVLTRLDHCNAVLAGLPAYQLNRLQAAISTAARMIYRT